jgi:hypothetical protein
VAGAQRLMQNPKPKSHRQHRPLEIAATFSATMVAEFFQHVPALLLFVHLNARYLLPPLANTAHGGSARPKQSSEVSRTSRNKTKIALLAKAVRGENVTNEEN